MIASHTALLMDACKPYSANLVYKASYQTVYRSYLCRPTTEHGQLHLASLNVVEQRYMHRFGVCKECTISLNICDNFLAL